MNEEYFRSWLSNLRHNVCGGAPLDAGTIDSRIANCRRVERFEGDLDDHFDRDQLSRLIDRLSYSRGEQRSGIRPRHRVPIDGDTVNGTATLKAAARLYKEFREHDLRLNGTGQHPANRPGALPLRRAATPPSPLGQHDRFVSTGSIAPPVGRPRLLNRSAWPIWQQPEPRELLALAHLVVPFVRFLNPDVVRAVVEDNERQRAGWIEAFKARGIDPGIYLWEKSPCAFPGVRRYAGSREIAAYRGHTVLNEGQSPNALDLDDNDYPKQIWSFVFQSKLFSKRGPDGYALAHLADHKYHGNRFGEDFDVREGRQSEHLYGLHTCPSNTVYLPATMIRPTDFAGPLRSLLIRRAFQLYASFCAILPTHLRIRRTHSAEWSLAAFTWAEPVGTTENVSSFLKFRNERLEELINQTRTRHNGTVRK